MEIGIATKVAAVDNEGCISVLNQFVQYYINTLMFLCFAFGFIHGIYLIVSVVYIRIFDEFTSSA
ncbi:hypothetical protein KSF78_0000119 [Schistosoma japonicum]|nr:hypothetical protein KSF78_0000119 [Schistosoma japonicum]KAH8849276.1 hypothetical protein KSF78_0000119 [Schistosoma japonicum]